jgi:hypothetical protein
MTDQQLEAWLHREYGATPGNQELIATAMLFWRRGREATARLDAEGLTVQPGKGLFRHPLVAVERECRLGFLNAFKALEDLTRRRKAGGPTKADQLPATERARPPARQYLRGA